MALLETQHLTKKFKMGSSDLTILHDINLIIDKGEFISITGKSGSGKSTLMHILGCLDDVTSGHYLFDGHDISQFSPDELAYIRNQRIGFVFQQFHLLPDFTSQENVALPHLYAGKSEQESMQQAANLLEIAGLSHRLHHYPNELSGGERQRVAISRALINNPAILLADEPTGNLDSATGTRIMDLFKKFNEEKQVTIVIVTHDNVLAQQTKRIIRLIDGKIIEDSKTS